MKKIYFVMAVCAMLFASCQKEPLADRTIAPSDGERIRFSGETHDVTKTTIAPKEGDTYPVYWAKGDKIGVMSINDTTFSNTSATLYGDGGSSSGIFTLDKDVFVNDTVDAVIYYPYSTYTKLETKEGITLRNVVPMEQKQLKASDNSYTGKYALASASVRINPTIQEEGYVRQDPVKFALNHFTAYVKLSVTSSKYSSYKLQGASIWSKGSALTGDIKVDVTNGTVSNVTPRDYAVVTLEEPTEFNGTQEFWFVTLPCDLSGQDIWVTVSMTDGTNSISIPVKTNGGQIKANTVNVINVNLGDNTLSWYQPNEKRYLAEAYAYGPENTIMVTSADAPIVFDVKARGYFIGCAEPKYVWVAKAVYGNTAPKLTINGLSLKNVDPNASLTVADCAPISSDCTITLDYTGTDFNKTTMAGKIVIADENLNTIWAFNLWHVSQYKEGVVSHTYQCGKQVMDRYLGSGYEPHSYDNWHAMGMYFQWGRPFGFGWSGGGAYKLDATSVTDIARSAFQAETFLTTNDVLYTMSDWYLGMWTNRTTDRKNDAWGNEATDEEGAGSTRPGTKSVLDPCPKGWMVCSPDVLQELVNAVGTDGFQLHDNPSTASANGEWGKYVREAVYKFGSGENDVAYWRFDGLKWGSNGGNPGNQVNDILCTYSNSSLGSGTSNIMSIYFRSKDAQWLVAGSRNSGCSVRCMKDADDR